MRFSLPGQLRGPECKRVMQQAIALRKRLEPWFASVDGGQYSELGVALRVDGSLGSFGAEGVENIVIGNDKIECDVVVADQGWESMSDGDIFSVLQSRVFDAIDACLKAAGITFDAATLTSTTS